MAKGKNSFDLMAQGLFSDEVNVNTEVIKNEVSVSVNDMEKDTEKKVKRPSTKAGLFQRGYYVTEQQCKNIKRLAVDRDTDTSSIVREALDIYFKDINL